MLIPPRLEASATSTAIITWTWKISAIGHSQLCYGNYENRDCGDADLNFDDHISQGDFGIFINRMGGANISL